MSVNGEEDPIANANANATATAEGNHGHGSGSGNANGMTMEPEPEPVILNVAQCTDLLIQKIHEDPEQAYLLRRFLSNILAQHGWSVALRRRVVEYIKKEGPDNVNVSHMWGDLAAEALEAIPPAVRVEVKEYLTQLGHSFIKVDDTVQVGPEADEESEDKKLYEFQSRDAVPEPPSGLYPPQSPAAGVESPEYVKPQWTFVYDKPKPQPPIAATAAASQSQLPTAGSDATGSSDGDNYETSSSDSSPYSNTSTNTNTNTPPETETESHGDGDEDQGHHGDGYDDKDKGKDKDKEREKKRKAARQQQQRQQQAGDRARLLKTTVVDENRKSNSKPNPSAPVTMAVGRSSFGVSVPVSPNLTGSLSQLKIVDKKASTSMGTGSTSTGTSKLSPSQQQRGPSNDLVDDEEEEELMDV